MTLLARKWIIKTRSGETLVVEGDKIFGQIPKLAPGETFSYNSYHVTGENCAAHGSFHGVWWFRDGRRQAAEQISNHRSNRQSDAPLLCSPCPKGDGRSSRPR